MTKKEGWAMPANTRKYHYFVDKRSLCGSWAFFGNLQPDDGKEGPDDCKACREKLEKMKK